MYGEHFPDISIFLRQRMKLGQFAIAFIAISSLARLQKIPGTFTFVLKRSVQNLHRCVL